MFSGNGEKSPAKNMLLIVSSTYLIRDIFMAFNITSSPTNAEILASLLGDTTGLSNIQITTTGNPLALGLFQDSPVNLTSGVVLSTGQVSGLVGANAIDQNNISTSFNGSGTVQNGFDAITITITFDVDQLDRQLFFQYVFGSDEFLDFSGSNFNDIFTFELNGQNLALLSNGSTASINNLTPSADPSTFSPDYINNLISTNPSSSIITLDGYTKPLSFIGNTIPSSTNSLVITIQDISDNVIDSAVFLAARTLGVSPFPVVSLSLSSSSVNEDGTENLVYTFTRDGSIQNPLIIEYLVGGTTDPTNDYFLPSDLNINSITTTTFEAGSSTATVVFIQRRDNLVESDETISVQLVSTGEPLYRIGTPEPVIGTILDQDTALNNISLTVLPSRVPENDNPSGNLIYTFVRTGPINESLAVDFNISSTAEFGTDYIVEGADFVRFMSSSIGLDPLYVGRATFASGSDRVTVIVNPMVDLIVETDETVTLNLIPSQNDTMFGGAGRIYNIDTPDAIVGTITDITPVVNVILESTSVNENGTTSLIYTFNRTGLIDQPLIVNYTVGGSASFGADYNQAGATSFENTTGSITFNTNSATATLTITPAVDAITEPDETVTLTLASNSTYTIGTSSSVTGSIIDPPVVVTPPTVSLAVNPGSVNEDGVENLVYTFTRTGSLGTSLTATYNVSGTATANDDYILINPIIGSSATVTFQAGASTATIVVDPTPDSLIERAETVELTLVPDGNGQYIIGTTAAVVGSILDRGAATIRTSAGDGELVVSVDEFGRFGSASGVGGNAFYDPLGGTTSNGTTYSSYVALGIIGDNGTTGARTVLRPEASSNRGFTNVNVTTANSNFTIGGLQFQLNQLVQDTRSTGQNRTGGRLDQTYTITNTTNQTINFELIRYVDGDLFFDNSLIDGGGRLFQSGQEILFETDRGGTGQTDTTFFGITGTGGTIPTTNRFEIDTFNTLDSNILAGSLLRDRIVQGDTDSNLFIDPGAEYDVTLGLRNTFSLAPGTSNNYTTTTRFGSGEPAQLDITPPVGGINSLASTTLGTNIDLSWSATDPSGVREYDVFVSTNGGAYIPFQSDVITTSATFTGVLGNTYAFYVLATDNAGNSQVITGAPIATTQLVTTLPPVTLPVITVTVNPISVDESATSGIVYTFNRTGSLGTSLTVSYNISGTAAFRDDYIQTGANIFAIGTGTIEFAENSSTATLTITPIADSILEPNETVDLTLLSGSGYGNSNYIIGTSNTLTGTIININEPPTSGLNFIGTNNLDVGAINNLSNGIFAVNPNNINLVGDEINLLGGANSVTVPGKRITLQPDRPNQNIQIGSADSNSADILDLIPADLAAIANGFSKIVFGRANGTGNISINSAITFRDPILLQSPSGQLNIIAPITLADDANLDFNVKSLVKSGDSVLTINGGITTTFIGSTIINGGTLLLAKAPNTRALNNGAITINSGTLQLGNNEQIDNAADLTLNGGTLNLNGFNETLDQLQVASNSSINLGNGSSKLAFGNSSSQNWTGILSIENWSATSGETIRFGNSAAGLTPSQLNEIQFVGFNRGATINTSGFIAPIDITVVNPTPDQDGVSEDIEDLAPNNGDGNLDGISDGLQENVASILNLGGIGTSGIATIIAKAGARISGLRSLANPINTANLTSLANPIEFKVTGLTNGAATIVEYLIAKADQTRNYNTYVMFGATADNLTPHAYEFLYDGQTGAELFDTNGDGFTDKAVVHFVDGLRGDSDLTVNGEIQDPGAPGIANTPVGLSTDANNVVQITGAAGTAIANFSLVANQTKKVNEVGFFKIDGTNRVRGIAANATGFAQAALQSGQVIFSSLADNLLSTADISRQLQLNAGDRLGFYLVQDGTVDAALQRNDFSNVLFSLDQANPAGRNALEVTNETNGSYRLKWEQGSATVADDLILNLQLQSNPLNNQNLVASVQGDRESELLDLSSFTGRDIQVNFTIKREAAFNDTVGFYKIEDAQGTVVSIAGAKIKPGEAGYQAAVVQNWIAGIDLTVANGQTVSIDAVLRGGAIYAPFLIANASPSSLNGDFSNVYTPYAVGNTDTTDHVRLLGDNTFGFEDLVGGGDRDFNDVVLKALFKNS
jgi:autotransporter-associated beta strand protein